MTALELLAEINEVYQHIQETSIHSDANQLMEELDYCNAELARSAQLEAEAEAILNKAKGEQSEKYADRITKENKFNATQCKMFIEGRTIDEVRVYRLAERLNSTLVHRIDSLRTKISFEKSLRDNSRN